MSYSSAKSEEEEGKTIGSILPVIFLAIAILTMITTMHRLVTAEKTQIGILKALGFKDRKIILHYTTFAIFISVVGSVLGVALGYAIARLIMNPSSAMGTYLDMPTWNLYMPWFGIVALIAMNLVVMSFMEKYREMSTLKVLGFKDKKIGNLLITKNMWISILGTIIGIPLGVWTLDYLIKVLASEYGMSLSISWLSFVISILITLGVSWLVSVVIANKNKKIDMVESLKCSE